jgi:hypothetical protein
MKMNRRDLLISGAFSLLAGTGLAGQNATPPRAPSAAPRSPSARLLDALQRNRLPLTMGGGPAGPGWDWLLQEARAARFTLIGEEHGVVETTELSTALFHALRESGYRHIAIELSPIIAQDTEAAARRNGVQGIAKFFSLPGVAGAVYEMREEAQFLATAVSGGARKEHVLWGLDREVFGDRYLISKLEGRVPQRARESFARLKQASTNAWARHQQDPNPDNLFCLSEDPAVVSAVRTAWTNPDREGDTILRTLEESLAISAEARTGSAWASAQRRAHWNRSNLAARVKDVRAGGGPPKVMLKFGYNHMIRGANYVNVFDLGAMTDEVAALSGDHAFHILVLPGPGSQQAVFGPGRSFVPVPSDEFDEFRSGDQRLTRVLPSANATGHEVIDLRALRPLAQRGLESWYSDVVRTIYGYDAAVIWKGARASSSLMPGKAQ